MCIADNLDATEIPDLTNVQRVASLLGVPKQPLIDALTRKTLFAHGETVVSETSCTAFENCFKHLLMIVTPNFYFRCQRYPETNL